MKGLEVLILAALLSEVLSFLQLIEVVNEVYQTFDALVLQTL